MKLRSELSAAEVDALWSTLERRLDGVGLETQPEVATRVVELVSDPKAGLRDFAAALRADPALSGRLLKLANSAFFAQRQAVTTLERACVLVGLERLKGVALGFYMSRASAADPQGALSRSVWAQAVYRACLASELAKQVCPMYAPEAFVVGLLEDAGIPLVAEWLGRPAREIYEGGEAPTGQFRREFAELEFTHVDVIAALARRWKLPPLLAKPLERHHVMPPREPGRGAEAGAVPALHRLAYYVGAVRLDADGRPPAVAPMGTLGDRLLGLSSDSLASITRRAGIEYGAMREMFADVAGQVGDLVALSETVHGQLVALVDRMMEGGLAQEAAAAGQMFVVGDQRVEVRVEAPDTISAYLIDGAGARLVSHVFKPGTTPTSDVLRALGVEQPTAPADDLDAYLRSLAA